MASIGLAVAPVAGAAPGALVSVGAPRAAVSACETSASAMASGVLATAWSARSTLGWIEIPDSFSPPGFAATASEPGDRASSCKRPTPESVASASALSAPTVAVLVDVAAALEPLRPGERVLTALADAEPVACDPLAAIEADRSSAAGSKAGLDSLAATGRALAVCFALATCVWGGADGAPAVAELVFAEPDCGLAVELWRTPELSRAECAGEAVPAVCLPRGEAVGTDSAGGSV